MKPVAARSIVKVGHVRMFVDCSPDAVSAKFRHHAKTDAPRFGRLNELFAESAPQLIGILGLVMPSAE